MSASCYLRGRVGRSKDWSCCTYRIALVWECRHLVLILYSNLLTAECEVDTKKRTVGSSGGSQLTRRRYLSGSMHAIQTGAAAKEILDVVCFHHYKESRPYSCVRRSTICTALSYCGRSFLEYFCNIMNIVKLSSSVSSVA